MNKQAEESHSSEARSGGTRADVLAMADQLIKDISGKASAIKQAIHTLDQEQARLEQDFNARRRELEKQRGRLNAYLVRLNGGAAVESTPASNGKSSSRSKRMTSQETQDLEKKIMELVAQHRDDGLRRSDVVEAFGLTGPQATRILSSLEQSDRLNATGAKAGRRYYPR